MRANETGEVITRREETEEASFVFLTGYSPVSLRNTISLAVRAELIPCAIVPSAPPQSVAVKHKFMGFLFLLEDYQTRQISSTSGNCSTSPLNCICFHGDAPKRTFNLWHAESEGEILNLSARREKILNFRGKLIMKGNVRP